MAWSGALWVEWDVGVEVGVEVGVGGVRGTCEWRWEWGRCEREVGVGGRRGRWECHLVWVSGVKPMCEGEAGAHLVWLELGSGSGSGLGLG